MKHLLLIAFAMTLGLQAQASTSASEFISDFVAQMNRRLVYMNQERITVQKRPYCTGLTPTQVSLIAQIVLENPEQTGVQFLEKLAPELKCYPIFFPPWGRKGMGILVNTKAYVMDIELIRSVLMDLRHGRDDDNRGKLLDSLEAPEFTTTDEF